ncbi:MAG: hypothetical protein ACREDG_03155, partial [Methylocella sp.]
MKIALTLVLALAAACAAQADQGLRVPGKPATTASEKAHEAPVAFRGSRTPSNTIRLTLIENGVRAQ